MHECSKWCYWSFSPELWSIRIPNFGVSGYRTSEYPELRSIRQESESTGCEYIHTYIHAYIHACIHTYICTQTLSSLRAMQQGLILHSRSQIWKNHRVWSKCYTSDIYEDKNTYIYLYIYTYIHTDVSSLRSLWQGLILHSRGRLIASGALEYLIRILRHEYIHTYIHTCMHACIHTYIHTYMYACMHAYIHTYRRQQPQVAVAGSHFA